MTDTENRPDNPFKNPKPFDIGEITGIPDLKNISYTAFDFYSIKKRVIEYIKKYFPDDFNDFVESDLGIMLIELWAYMADLISFKLDLYANEVFVDTVSQLKNAHRLAKLVGYPVRPPRAAIAKVSMSIPNPYSFDIKIQRGYFLSLSSRDGNSLNFELYPADEEWNPILNQDIYIPAGSVNNLSVVALEGTSSSVTFTSTGIRNQSYFISTQNILENSIEVYVNNQKWINVDFFNENDNGPYYLIEYDEKYRVLILFADDVKGKIPPAGAKISVNFRYGGGSRGNISTGYINQIANITSNLIPGSIPVVVTNYTKGEGGENAESINEIKSKLPLWNKAQNRAVSGEDYSFLAEKFSTIYHGRIGKAIAVLRNSGCSGNIIDIYVLQQETEKTLITANSVLKRELLNYMNSIKMLTDYVCIKDAGQVFQNININVEVNKFYFEFKKDINDRVIETVNDFFDLNKWRIGQPLKKYDLIQYLNSIPNITSVDIEFVANNQNLISSTDNLLVDFWKIIRPGNINISVNMVS